MGASPAGPSRSPRRTGRFGLFLLAWGIFGPLLALPALAGSPALGPEWIPADDPLYEDVRWMVLEGSLPAYVWSLRPITRIELARLLAASMAGPESEPTPVRLRLARELAVELEVLGASSSEPSNRPIELPLGTGLLQLRPYAWVEGSWGNGEVDWGDRARLGLRGTAHLSSSFTLHENIFAGEVRNGRRFADALINHTDFLIFLEEVYAGYQGSMLRARLGRMRESWGPEVGGSLLLDAGSAPFEHLEIDWPFGRLRLRTLVGVLQSGREKNLAAHRLEWAPTRHWTFGFAEGAIFHGNPWQPLYALGIVPYAIVERLQGQDAISPSAIAKVRNNVLYQVDVTLRGNARALWASLLLDDVATETSEQPSRLGFVLGAETSSRFCGQLRWGIEAAKIYDYTYSVYYENSDWSHQAEPLGFPLGPDVERIRWHGRWQGSARWGGDAQLHWTRRGEGRIGRPWFPPMDPRAIDNPEGPASELSGRVEQRVGGVVGVRYEPRAGVSCGLEVTTDWVSDRNHQPRQRTPEGNLRVRVHLYR